MPAAPLPIAHVSIDPNSGAARQNNGVQSHSRRSGSAEDRGAFASVLARRSGIEADRGTKAKTVPDPAAKVATKGPSADSSVEQGKDKSKTASKDSKDSKAAAQVANMLLAAPQLPVSSARPNKAVGKAQLQQLAKDGRIVPGPSDQSGSLLPESPDAHTKLIGQRMDTALDSPAALLDHGGVAKTLTSKRDRQRTDTVKMMAPTKDPSGPLLKNLFTQNLLTLVGSQQGKDQGQTGADFKQGGAPGWVGSPIGLPITPTATPGLPAVTATSNFSNALANLYAGSTGWNEALGNEVVWMARGDMRQVRLRLYPQRLGSLDVHIQLQQQHVNVAFVVQHPAAAGAVQEALAQLGGMFAQQGLNLGDTQVSYGQSPTSPAWPTAGKRDRDVDESGDIALSGLSRHGLGLFDDFA